MDQRELKKGMDGRDALDNEVTALLSALPRVEAPENFEFGVRAKIARGTSRSSWSPSLILKVVAPLALLLLVTGFVFFYGTLEPRDVPTVAEAPRQTKVNAQVNPELPTVATATPSVPELRPEQPSPIQVASQRPARPVRRAGNNQTKRNRGGSVDMPLGGGGSVDISQRAPEPILPAGFEAVNARRAEVAARNVLEILGLTVEFPAGECKVSSVAENSLAARAGMKAGDVIETVDGRPLASDTKLKGTGAKSFVVRRDDKRLNLRIGN